MKTVCADLKYLTGHLRYGHREGVIEADSKEDLLNKLKNGEAKVLILSDATCIKDMWKKEDCIRMNIQTQNMQWTMK